MSREALDAALVEQAIAAGVQFIDGTTAELGELSGNSRTLVLKQLDRRIELTTSVVVAADGSSVSSTGVATTSGRTGTRAFSSGWRDGILAVRS